MLGAHVPEDRSDLLGVNDDLIVGYRLATTARPSQSSGRALGSVRYVTFLSPDDRHSARNRVPLVAVALRELSRVGYGQNPRLTRT